MSQTTAREAIRVALLTDQPIVELGVRQLLESGTGQPGFTYVGAARDAAQGVELVERCRAEVTLVDLDGDLDVHAVEILLGEVRHVCRVVALSASRDADLLDAVVLAGAMGVVDKREAPDVLRKAITKVHAGEFWLGRSATVRILMSVVRRQQGLSPEQERIAQLTRKERLAVAEIARDPAASGREIAARLHISEHTLRNHLSSIYAKLGVANRTALYDFALRHGLGRRAAGGNLPR
ncbi:Transcriptional regulatory protein LiaR [Tepidimonas sediminis]|uniref:Transcriptional regulatory protein LiaR n=1 Tax=Tepidimonas sediminis TaxID=2588941 RepID=A0A554WMS8_9BURK|nr:response regulator transcription factor [Tepidimonas sediminis]TSE24875.1 Transcriptional regulatory protein LiaR [Tepidimonas sediminis]